MNYIVRGNTTILLFFETIHFDDYFPRIILILQNVTSSSLKIATGDTCSKG